ncbi:MAG TPA: thiamine pyrophosphate-binding protein, partial [Clostridiaceae bacterium]|nr:thiamine pyrophosphate-binding protein [Clostridiaceae bacterium]
VEVPSGGGALYAVPGVSEANLSNIPLLCIASEISMSSDEMNALTDCNQVDLFAAVSKWNTKIVLSSKIPQMVRKAIRMSTSGIPGATVLTVPENLLREEFDGDEKNIYALEQAGSIGRLKNDATNESANKLIEMIRASSKPVVLAGGGVHLSVAHEALENFAEKFSIPVVSSIDGKGSIAEISEYSIGTVGANGGSVQANTVVKEADLIIILGSKLDNVTTMGGKLISPDAEIIQVDLSDEVLANVLRVTYPILSDIGMLLKKTSELDDGFDYHAKFEDWMNFAREKKLEKLQKIQEDYKRESEYVVAARVFEALEKLTDENAIFVGDAGTPTPYISSYLQQKKAGKQNVIPRAHGALGYALGASLGAQVGRPESRVFSLFGDGSFGMAMGDLETAARRKLPIIFMNFQNDCFGWIKTIQRLYYEEDYFGVDFSCNCAVKIAEGMGVQGRHIGSNSEIEEAIKWAIDLNEPVFLNVVVEPPTDYVPPVYQWEVDDTLSPDMRKKLVY